MQIDSPDLTFAEKMVLDLRRPRIGLALSLIFRYQATVLRLKTGDSIHYRPVSDEKGMIATLSAPVMPTTPASPNN
jgi:hypothetical protein